jgi:hypothetical protein
MTDDLQRSLGRVESKVDMLLERSVSYEKRLHAVEKRSGTRRACRPSSPTSPQTF